MIGGAPLCSHHDLQASKPPGLSPGGFCFRSMKRGRRGNCFTMADSAVPCDWGDCFARKGTSMYRVLAPIQCVYSGSSHTLFPYEFFEDRQFLSLAKSPEDCIRVPSLVSSVAAKLPFFVPPGADVFVGRGAVGFDGERRPTLERIEWDAEIHPGDWVEFRNKLDVPEHSPEGWFDSVDIGEADGQIENGLAAEVSTKQAAKLLGCSKDTVLKLKDAGLLDYRNAAPPDSSRPVYRFSLLSIREFRNSHDSRPPQPSSERQPNRRARRVRQSLRHFRYDDK